MLGALSSVEKIYKRTGNTDMRKQLNGLIDIVDEIGKDTKLFMELLDRVFAPDIRVAFEGSIDLAKSCGYGQGKKGDEPPGNLEK